MGERLAIDEERRHGELMGPAPIKFDVSDNFEKALESEVRRLRLKDKRTERALRMVYRILAPWPAARKAFLEVFPEAEEV